MDVKSAFLYGTIEEEVYVCQPPGFEDPQFPNKVYKVDKALYGLHQAPRAWYETLSTYLIENGFRRGIIDKTLFIKKDKGGILLVQVFQVTPKTSHLHAVKRIFRYLKGQPKLGLWYPRDSPFDLEAFSDSDYAGASLDRKSTTGAEYVVAANYCGQVLWIQNQMLDYGFNFMNTKIYIDNESTICIVKNPVFHSKTKHIEIRHHFIRDCYEKKLIQVIKIHTDHNVADLLTKAFDVSSQFSEANTTIFYGKAVVISESSVRNDLLFNDEDGIACLTNDEIFDSLALMGYEQLSTKLTFQKGGRPRSQDTTLRGADTQTRPETASKTSRDPPLSEVNTSGRGEDSMEYHDDLTDFVPPTPHASPFSGGNTPGSNEGRMELIQELMKACTSLIKRVLALEEAKTAQDRVVTKLKLRVKRLEKKKKAITPQPMKRRLFKGRVETSTDKSLGEDASKQGRNDDKIEELNLTDEADTEVIVEDKGSGEKCGSTADQVSTVRPEVSAASVPVNVSASTPSTPPTTTTIFGDEDLTIAQTLVKMISEKAKEKEKGVVLIDEEEPPRLNRSTTTLEPLPTINPKDKGKGVLVEEEPEKPVKLAELDRAQKERQKQEEATSAALVEEFDKIQARIDADHELAIRLTHEEQAEKYKIEQRARLLAEFFERRKKQLTAERAEAIRNKPPTRTQVRNMMITYLKHMGKYTHQQLKHKNFEEVQKLYEREKKWIDDFKPIDDDSQQQAESTKKRPRADSEEESFKK
ncbi:putative ribonuclease H-like domain-containing protein [Tanacetum coccineum]|uniref:Ribonuclease H-like domain-containing protein n=1 Tax=Tanacetum coccineum TaxID=301880 RepID=A0ABQ4ZU38_9ASTR